MITIKRFFIWKILIEIMLLVSSTTVVNSGTEETLFHNLQWGSMPMMNISKVVQRIDKGQQATINSLGFLMIRITYGFHNNLLSQKGNVLSFSPQCFVTWARAVSSSETLPPTVNTIQPYMVQFPRPDCETVDHQQEIFLNANPYFDVANSENDIAIIKTKKPIENNKCGGPPVEQAWISCDDDGPPANYSDCFMASYGPVRPDQGVVSAPDNPTANKLQVIILSQSDCQKASQQAATIRFDEDKQICATGLDGIQRIYNYDFNAVLYCKYWKPESSPSNNGWESTAGWKSNSKSPSNENNGWGWHSPKKQNLLAVGHVENYFGNVGDPGVDILVKYGSTSYRQLFGKCNYICSDNLEKGYRCRGNPPKSLGPVYCYPEKIPNHGWSP